MALTMKDTGLVGGVPMKDTPLTALKVLRGFYTEDQKPAKPGEIVLCSERFAKGLIANGKAERVVIEPALPTPEPEPAPEPEKLEVKEEVKEEEEQPTPRRRRRGSRFTNED
jgi:hypothetical protein